MSSTALLGAGGTVRSVPTAQPRQAVKEAGRGQQKRDSAPVPAQQPPAEEVAQGERVTVGDFLVDSLTAQSLDLPPHAAKVSSLMLARLLLLVYLSIEDFQGKATMSKTVIQGHANLQISLLCES